MKPIEWAIVAMICMVIFGICYANYRVGKDREKAAAVPAVVHEDQTGLHRVYPGQCYIGYMAGNDVVWTETSHVFIGPTAGTGYSKDELPLVEFRNGKGEIMFKINPDGSITSPMSQSQLKAEFENYDFQGREYRRLHPQTKAEKE